MKLIFSLACISICWFGEMSPSFESFYIYQTMTIYLAYNISKTNGLYFANTDLSEMKRFETQKPPVRIISVAILGYNNQLQNRFDDIHPKLWSVIHFLEGKESLVMIRTTTQIRNGNYCYKVLGGCGVWVTDQ